MFSIKTQCGYCVPAQSTEIRTARQSRACHVCIFFHQYRLQKYQLEHAENVTLHNLAGRIYKTITLSFSRFRECVLSQSDSPDSGTDIGWYPHYWALNCKQTHTKSPRQGLYNIEMSSS